MKKKTDRNRSLRSIYDDLCTADVYGNIKSWPATNRFVAIAKKYGYTQKEVLSMLDSVPWRKMI